VALLINLEVTAVHNWHRIMRKVLTLFARCYDPVW
jgi:hypothetical protein